MNLFQELVILQCGVTCIICISNKVEYLEQEHSKKINIFKDKDTNYFNAILDIQNNSQRHEQSGFVCTSYVSCEGSKIFI